MSASNIEREPVVGEIVGDRDYKIDSGVHNIDAAIESLRRRLGIPEVDIYSEVAERVITTETSDQVPPSEEVVRWQADMLAQSTQESLEHAMGVLPQ